MQGCAVCSALAILFEQRLSLACIFVYCMVIWYNITNRNRFVIILKYGDHVESGNNPGFRRFEY